MPRRIRGGFLVTTDSTHGEPIYPNLLPELSPTGADQLWVADLTYIRLAMGFVYLAVKHEDVFDCDPLLYCTIHE